MNGSLPQELEKRIHDWVAEGKYGSVDAALTAAVQVLHDRELSREGNEWLRAQIQLGIDDIKNGRVTPLDMANIVAECHAEYDARRK